MMIMIRTIPDSKSWEASDSGSRSWSLPWLWVWSRSWSEPWPWSWAWSRTGSWSESEER